MRPWWEEDAGILRRLRRRATRIRRPADGSAIRHTRPLSDRWGLDRGTPIDRFYIERFLAEERAAIRGRVLEVRDDRYTVRFGAGVEEADVLDIDPSNDKATIVADLAVAHDIPDDAFDCFLLTQTLQFVFDVPGALHHAHRILAPGGTLLCTVPAVSRISMRYLDSDYWRFTVAGLRGLVAAAFPGSDVSVRSYGNVFTCAAFLRGLAREELSDAEVDDHDPFFPLLVAVRATKPDRAS